MFENDVVPINVSSEILIAPVNHHLPGNNTHTMILRSSGGLSRTLKAAYLQRHFLTSSSAPQNRIFDNIRTPNDLHTLTMLSATANRPLITLWSASWCSNCKAVKPLVRDLIEEERVGEAEGGLGFAEVELDSTLIGDLGVKYMVRCGWRD